MAKRVDPNTPLNPGDISAGSDVARYNNQDTAGRARVADTLSRFGIDPSKSLASQIVSGQDKILAEHNKLSDELRTLTRAQEQGIALKNQDERLRTVTSKLTTLSEILTQTLSGGLPQLRNEKGHFTGQQNSELEVALVRVVHQINNQTAAPSPYTTAFSNIRSDVRYVRATAQGMAIDPDSRGRIEEHGKTLERAKYELRQGRKEAMDRGDTAAARQYEQFEIELANVETERANILAQGIDKRPEYVRDIEKLKLEHRAVSGGGVSDAFKKKFETSRARMQGEIPDLQRRRAEALEAGDYEAAAEIDEELSKKGQFISSTEDRTLPYAERMSQIRTKTKVGAAINREGGQIPAELRTELERHRDELRVEIPELNKKALEATLAEDWESAEKLMKEQSSKSQGLKALMDVLEGGNNKQNNALNNVLKHVATVVSALGVGQLVSRAVLQEPYRFGTVPALGVLGQQGEIGQMMSNAYGQLKEYELGINQQAFGVGAGMTGLGLSMGMRAPGIAGKAVGATIAAGGVLLGSLGLSGNASDAWFGLGGTTDKEEILGASFAQQVADPGRLVGNFANSRAGLMAAGGLRLDNFGYSNESQTGNVIHDRMSALTALGYSQEDLGGLLSATASNLIGSETDMTNYATTAGRVGTAYGLDDQSVLAMMQQSQRYGSRDAESSLFGAMGAAAGPDGQITTFTTSVLVPAILGAIESLSLSNLARTGKDLEDEVFSLHSTIVNSDTNLGTLMQAQPALIGQIGSTVNQTVKGYIENPAMMAFQMMLGVKPSEVARGELSAIEPSLRYALSLPQLQGVDFGSGDLSYLDKLSTNRAAHLAMGLTGLPYNPQLFDALAGIVQDGGTLFDQSTGEPSAEARAALEAAGVSSGTSAEAQLNARVESIVSSKVGRLTASLAEQTNEALKVTIGIQDHLLALQTEISNFVRSEELTVLAEAGIAEIMDTVRGLLGTRVSSGGRDTTPAAERVETSVETGGFARPSSNISDYYPRRSTGGYTGIGGAHTPAGVVHAGEYVISNNNVVANKDMLERIQSGERVSTSKTGNTTIVTLKVQGMDPRDIYEMAERATAEYVTRTRINYT